MNPGGLVVAGLAALAVVFGRVGPVLKAPYHPPEYPLNLCADPRIELERSLAFWADHGVHFTVNEPGPCIPVLLDPTLLPKHRGLTLYLEHTAVVLVANPRDELAVAHELGHAAGYGHVPLAPSGLVMARTRVGWDDRGLRRR